MPLTFAHPAAVLPFSKPAGRYLSLTGLVIGSMTPDFEYFIRMKLLSRYSHAWQGLFWFDLPLGIMLVIVYEFWIKDQLITHLPAAFNRRFFIFKGYREYYSAWYLIAIAISVLLGAASHIIWDGFTHPTGYFVHTLPHMRHQFRFNGYKVYLYTCLQYLSTVLGALLMLIICLSLPKQQLTQAKNIAAFWLQILLVTMVVIAIRLATGLHWDPIGNVVITVIDGGILGLIVASLINK